MMQEGSIQSKRYELWTRMYGLLELNPGAVQEAGRARVLMAVRPTVSVEGLLSEPQILQAVVTQVVGAVNYHTVPDDEQWLLYGVNAVLSAGDRDVGEINLLEPSNLGANSFPLFKQSAGASAFKMFERPIPIYPTWTLRLIGEGGATDGNWTMQLLVEISPSHLT